MGSVFVFIKNKSRRKPGGFTLIELMITCLIISVLVMIAIPLYRQAMFRAHEQVAVNNLYSIYQAEKQYWFDVTPNQYTGLTVNLTDYVDFATTDNYWLYFLALNGEGFTATAQYVRNPPVRLIEIDETGSLTFTNWPPP
ncbi:MAG: prepilin-type N-terminal cleavage/methylation domain-containing protein [Candidatus Omnitrophica bacterium]|nr:prepilin-type N-terminal cleavage/methylation domain-containing protein [Candidatus Omnitrophota bacterium]MBU4479693.1 prepilin-type N-terminal cleavage/methylation domain-containing protein [Candidatus Omnitrophota bacterium]MCG2703116.1 prepilin-type N-terminal cleavage/methylation domain-containing protein [Candidatus Omnitrophota bacterium]